MMEFIECDSCKAKPGTPTLCAGCLHNRAVIGKLLRTPVATAVDQVECLREALAALVVEITVEQSKQGLRPESRTVLQKAWATLRATD